MLRKILLVGLVYFTGAELWAQVGNCTSGPIFQGNDVRIPCEQADVWLSFCQDRTVRVRTSWDRSLEDPEPYMVVQYDWPDVAYSRQETDSSWILETAALKIILTKTPFSISFYTAEGALLSEGVAETNQHERVQSEKKRLPDEHFFGFGERMDRLDRTGRTLDLSVGRGEGQPHEVGAYNILEANYAPVPFFMSTRGYGIFLHNSYATHWDMGASSPEHYTFGAAGGELDYYFFYGPAFADILNAYTDLTGKSPLMNRFAFGLHVGTYSGGTWGHEAMTSGHYVVALVEKFRALGIPMDVLHLDSTWRIFGKNGGKGATSFEWRETFTDPRSMFDSLYALHVNMVGLHVRPRFDNGNQLRLLDTARELGYVYPETDHPGEFVNFFDTAAVNWWWQQGVRRVADQGAMFLKTDEGSAFGRKANESDKVGPRGKEIARLHNLFPIVYAKAPYEKFQTYNQLRGMNHTREGYAGIQRYPFIFAGDWPSEWQYFEPIIRAGLNIGLSGVGYWAHCMGGFEHDADPELYIRWTQFGLLSPVAHLFGMDHPGYKEPWNYGTEAEQIFKKYDSLRYSLIPYLYSNAWIMYRTGAPIMRALVFDYQHDLNTYSISDEYLLGTSILVAPVTTKGAQSRTVYLPAGKWYDHWTGKVYTGGRDVLVVTPLDELPLFYKAGAIIPSQDPVQYVDDEPLTHLTLDIYPDSVSTLDLYEDDGHTLDYQKGTYTLTAIRCEANSQETRLFFREEKAGYELPERTYTIRIHAANAPNALTVTRGKKVKKLEKWSFDPQTEILVLDVKKAFDEPMILTIR